MFKVPTSDAFERVFCYALFMMMMYLFLCTFVTLVTVNGQRDSEPSSECHQQCFNELVSCPSSFIKRLMRTSSSCLHSLLRDLILRPDIFPFLSRCILFVLITAMEVIFILFIYLFLNFFRD